MTKCDFCTKMQPNGKCWWSSHVAAESDCERAIRNMVRVLSSTREIKERERWR